MSGRGDLLRVLSLTGVGIPRGLLGPESWSLARALSGEGEGDVADLAGAAAAVHWPALRGPIAAALERALGAAEPGDRAAIAAVLEMAADDDPDGPLPRALAVRAAGELAAAHQRARERLVAAENAVSEGGVSAAAAAATAAGTIAADLLDLDPEDFAPEIAAYVERGRRPEDVAELARATGDAEIRAWARAAVASAGTAEAAEASEGMRRLAEGPPPPDAAEDLVWVPTILALAGEAVERALAEEGGAPPEA